MAEKNSIKRKRIALSCDNCRKKKTKCDRKLPCGYCVKLSIPHTCAYSSPNHVNNSAFAHPELTIQQELQQLKLKIRDLEGAVKLDSDSLTPSSRHTSPAGYIHREELHAGGMHIETNEELLFGNTPVESKNEFISFYFSEDENGKRVSKPTLPFLSLLKSDPGVKLFWIYFNQPNVGVNFRDIFFNRNTNNNEWRNSINQKAINLMGDNYIQQLSGGYTLESVKRSLSNWGRSYGVIFNPIDISKFSLEDKIISVLNTMAPIQLYINVFFSKLYPYFPLISEREFRNDVSRILGIGYGLRDKVFTVTFEKSQDKAIIATLFYICKLSHQSLFHNNIKRNCDLLNSTDMRPWIKEIKFIMLNPVPIEAIKVADECINTYNLIRKQDLSVLIALIFSRLYERYSPEVGDLLVDGDSQVFNGVLIQVAFSLGLNRDPDYCKEGMSDEVKHLRRKVWYFLINLDIMDTIRLGTTISVNSTNYDTKLPYYTTRDEDGPHDLVEEKVSKTFIMLRPLIIGIQNLANLVVNIKSSIELTMVTESVKELETILAKMFGDFKDFLEVDAANCDSFVILSMTYYIRAKLFLVVVYFRLYTHYLDRRNLELEFYYYNKVYITLFYELAEVPQAASLENVESCGTTFSLIYTPVLANYLHISTIVSAAFSIRLQSSIRSINVQYGDDVETYLQALHGLLVLNIDCTRDSLSRTAKLGTRYYYCWKNKKAFMYAIKLLRDEYLYTMDLTATNAAALRFSTDQILQLDKILKLNRTVFGVDLDKDLKHDLNLYPLSPQSTAKTEQKLEDIDYIQELQIDNFWCELHNVIKILDASPNSDLSYDQNSKQTDNSLNDINYQQLFPNEHGGSEKSFFNTFWTQT